MTNLEFLIPEFEPREKTLNWYIYLTLVVAVLVLFAYLTENYTFIGLVLIGAAFIIFKSTRKPAMFVFRLSDTSMTLGDKEWKYDEIKSFSLFQIESRNYFAFTPKGRFRVSIKIPVVKPEEIRDKLNNLVSQVEYSESFTEVLGRVIGL